MCKDVSISGHGFWLRKLGIDISNRFALAEECSKESSMRLMHFKICRNIYPTNILLSKMKISPSDKCDHCKVPDVIEHFFIHCQRLKGFWEHIYKEINNRTDFKFQQNIKNILFGYIPEEAPKANKHDIKIANYMILLAKVCISKMRYGPRTNIFVIFESEWDLRKTKETN